VTSYERPRYRLSSPVGCPSEDLNQGAAYHLFGDVVRRLLRERRRAVPLATGVKIVPMDLSGFSSFQVRMIFMMKTIGWLVFELCILNIA